MFVLSIVWVITGLHGRRRMLGDSARCDMMSARLSVWGGAEYDEMRANVLESEGLASRSYYLAPFRGNLSLCLTL